MDLISTSLVLATIQTNGGANVSVKRMTIDTVGNTFTITLTALATVNVKVAWLLLN